MVIGATTRVTGKQEPRIPTPLSQSLSLAFSGYLYTQSPLPLQSTPFCLHSPHPDGKSSCVFKSSQGIECSTRRLHSSVSIAAAYIVTSFFSPPLTRTTRQLLCMPADTEGFGSRFRHATSLHSCLEVSEVPYVADYTTVLIHISSASANACARAFQRRGGDPPSKRRIGAANGSIGQLNHFLSAAVGHLDCIKHILLLLLLSLFFLLCICRSALVVADTGGRAPPMQVTTYDTTSSCRGTADQTLVAPSVLICWFEGHSQLIAVDILTIAMNKQEKGARTDCLCLTVAPVKHSYSSRVILGLQSSPPARRDCARTRLSERPGTNHKDETFHRIDTGTLSGVGATILTIYPINAPPNQFVDNTMTTLLMVAAEAGFLEVMAVLLQYGADTHLVNTVGEFALFLAADRGHVKCVKLLLEYDGPLNSGTFEHRTPLMQAAYRGHTDIVHYLVNFGALMGPQVNPRNESPLILACCQGHFEIAKYLLEYADFEQDRTNELYIALSRAAMRGDRSLIHLLIKHGASVNHPASTIRPPLFAAVFNGDVDTVNYFLQLGASTERRDEFGCTPLMLAARLGNPAIVRSLLMAGANIFTTREGGCETALFFATKAGHSEISQMLLNCIPKRQPYQT
uniref:Ankyrin repeat and KH domain containing protein n=1 Tax=Echinococcus granulosus TaxID=6210 RepID=A0A068WPQ8_ECHGR|nr:ankyrin repeat and KH domain containing protein [Echinococcus granulosus]